MDRELKPSVRIYYLSVCEVYTFIYIWFHLLISPHLRHLFVSTGAMAKLMAATERGDS